MVSTATGTRHARWWPTWAWRRAPLSVTVPITTLNQIAALPDGAKLVAGVTAYAANCVACHGSNG